MLLLHSDSRQFLFQLSLFCPKINSHDPQAVVVECRSVVNISQLLSHSTVTNKFTNTCNQKQHLTSKNLLHIHIFSVLFKHNSIVNKFLNFSHSSVHPMQKFSISPELFPLVYILVEVTKIEWNVYFAVTINSVGGFTWPCSVPSSLYQSYRCSMPCSVPSSLYQSYRCSMHSQLVFL